MSNNYQFMKLGDILVKESIITQTDLDKALVEQKDTREKLGHVLIKQGSLGEDDLVEFCTKVMARHKRPRIIKFVTSLPKSAVGKIQKNIIREPYWVQRDKNI